MKRLSELNGEAFMDAFYALSPLLPVLETIDIGGITDSEKTAEERGLTLITKTVVKLIPLATNKENRHCIWNLLSILEEKSVAEIKEYPAPKLIYKIRKIFAEGELANFTSYSEELDSAE